MRLLPALIFEGPDLRIDTVETGGALIRTAPDGCEVDPERAVEVAVALLEHFGPEGILDDLRDAVRTRRLRLVGTNEGGAA